MSALFAGAASAKTGGTPAAHPIRLSETRHPGRLAEPNHNEWAKLPDHLLVEFARAGDAEALDLLFRRHWRYLRGFSIRVSRNPLAAEDLLQEACVKVVANIGRLSAGANFRCWTCGFVWNEVRASRKKLKKVGTPGPREDINILESMTVEAHNGAEVDRLTILNLLAQALLAMAASARPAGAYMLQHLAASEELPPVRSVAAAAHLSLGAAERAWQGVLQCWRRKVASEFLPG